MTDTTLTKETVVLNYNKPTKYKGKRVVKLVDQKCIDLAEHFCQDGNGEEDHAQLVKALAEAFQDTAEDFFSSLDYESGWDQE